VKELTDDTFNDALKAAAQKGQKATLVKVWSETCGHCKLLNPKYEEANDALQQDGIELMSVNASRKGVEKILGKFPVSGVPTVLVLDEDGKNILGTYVHERDGKTYNKGYMGNRTPAAIHAFAKMANECKVKEADAGTSKDFEQV